MSPWLLFPWAAMSKLLFLRINTSMFTTRVSLIILQRIQRQPHIREQQEGLKTKRYDILSHIHIVSISKNYSSVRSRWHNRRSVVFLLYFLLIGKEKIHKKPNSRRTKRLLTNHICCVLNDKYPMILTMRPVAICLLLA